MNQQISPFSSEFSLSGKHVHLMPLAADHAEDLFKASAESRTSYTFTHVPSSLEAMRNYVAYACDERASKKSVPFVVFSKTQDRIVGTSRFGFLEYWTWPQGNSQQRSPQNPDAAEIGWTWLSASSQRTPINTEMKFLMLQYAFEEWNLHRITFRTDSRNLKSRAAIERIGAKLDGILRSNMPAFDGTIIRDSAFYSILKKEWDLTIKKALLLKFC